MCLHTLCVFFFLSFFWMLSVKRWESVIVLSIFELIWVFLVLMTALVAIRFNDLHLIVYIVSYLVISSIELVLSAYLLILLDK